MNESAEKVITLRLSETEKKALRDVMYERGEDKWQPLLKRLLFEWAEAQRPSAPAKTPVDSPSGPNAQIHAWLEEILQSGNESTINAIIANIKTFVVQARIFKGDVDRYLRIERKVENEGGKKKLA